MKAKLIVWDLDDTLWDGTLAEGTALVLNTRRASFVRELNDRGVVNSICSKNDYDAAKAALEKFDLWDNFVFCEIAFAPKGPLVKRIIADMQLRPVDVVYIDDNELNLREVEYECPGIQALNALDPNTDKALEALLESLDGVRRDRLTEYRQLERKRADAHALGTDRSNAKFLATCGIRMSVVRNTDNLPHAHRIEELINRTNQLNFTKSRVAEGSMAEYVVNPKNETFSVFVWDKYGFYGLVGFAAIEGQQKLAHFTFSCRIMNMGIESSLAKVLARKRPNCAFPVEPTMAPWIQCEFASPETLRECLTLAGKTEGPITYRIMARCQSGALFHYIGLPGGEWDNWPRDFRLQSILQETFRTDEFEIRPVMIYAAFGDYDDRYWNAPPTPKVYAAACEKFADLVSGAGSHAIVLLPIEDFTKVKNGMCPARAIAFNRVWRDLAARRDNIELIDMGSLSPDMPRKEARHYSPEILAIAGKELAARTRRALARQNAAGEMAPFHASLISRARHAISVRAERAPAWCRRAVGGAPAAAVRQRLKHLARALRAFRLVSLPAELVRTARCRARLWTRS